NREEFMSMTIQDIRPAEDVDILHKILDVNIKSGRFNKSIVRHQKKNGEEMMVKVEGNSVDFEGREARLVLAVDVTESIQAQQVLKESEHRFKALVQEGSDLIGIMGEKGYYKYVSPSTRTILGLKPEQLI